MMNDKVIYDRVIELPETGRIGFESTEDGSLVILPRQTEAGNGKDRLSSDPVLHIKGTVCCLRAPDHGPGMIQNGYPAGSWEVLRCGDFFRIGSFSFYYSDHRLWTQNREDLLIRGIPYENLPDRNSYPAFRRNTRIQGHPDDTPMEILDPPAMPEAQEGSFAIRLLPSLGMLAAAGLMAARGGTAMLVFSGISAGTGVFAAIAGAFSSGRKYRKTVRERKQVYERYLRGKREELDKAREQERQWLKGTYPDLKELLQRLRRFSPDLFERRRQDDDFLMLRLGTGNVKSKKLVQYRKHDQLEALDELSMQPRQIGQDYLWLKEVPVVCDLKQAAVLGITGREPQRFALLRNIVLDAALHQYHLDLKMIFIAEKEHAQRLHWLRFLPHSCIDPQHLRGIATDEESRDSIFEYLCRELSRRREEPGRACQEAHILVFLYDEMGFRVHPVSRFLKDAKELGVTFLFFADKRTDLVQGCDQLIEIKNPETAVITAAADGEQQSFFTFSVLSEKQAAETVASLAPVYTREVSLDPTLAREYTLFQMLHISKSEELIPDYGTSGHNFASPERPCCRHSLAAPVGIGRTGPVYLDIHDAAHGPHGLVAGTTGSGKSELLQTYILSMAVRFHPHEVGFLIIDYKGGTMAGPFSSMPHLLGTITNIDGAGARRALRSIRAELVKRQQLFERVQVTHIDRYMQLHGNEKPLPHLIIIIDEFAELKAAQPEFMQELISAARIGRSLGVHLILATQKPSGQVSEQIWSNSRFRICLKVQDAADSKEVLKSPLAAEIREPGRAWLQVGNREVFELFQSAYSSCPEESGTQGQKPFSIYQVSDTGSRTLVYQKQKRISQNKTTQMDAAVRQISRYCSEHGIRKLPDVFCPPLPPVIPYRFRREGDAGTCHTDCLDSSGVTRSKESEGQGFMVDIGRADDPDHQAQPVYTLDLRERHVLIVGSSRKGKTAMLETIIRDAAHRYTPSQLHIYIVDYASRQLKQMEGLLHVGGVVCASDREKTERLFQMLSAELERRKRGLEAGECTFPRILLVIDHLSALKEMIFQEDERLLVLCNEGLQAGIHVAAANPQASSAGYRYLSLFGEKIALHCNDSGEYHYLFDHPTDTPEDLPGRFFAQRGGIIYQGQCFLAFEADTPEGKNESVRHFKEVVRQMYPNSSYVQHVKPIPVLPDILTMEDMKDYISAGGSSGFLLPAGIRTADISVHILDLTAQGALLLVGLKGSGRHNWIRWVDRYLCHYASGSFCYYIADGLYQRFAWLSGRKETAFYSADPEKADQLVLAVEEILKARYRSILMREQGTDPVLLILLIDSGEALDVISSSPEAMQAFRNITGRYKSLFVCPIILCMENAPVSFQSPEILRDLRDMKNCLYFGDLASFRLFELPYSVSRQAPDKPGAGQAWHLCGAECVPVKTPLVS